MGVHRRDRNERVTDGAPPRIRITRGKDGALELTPDGAAEDAHPETVAEERPPQADDPRPNVWRDVGGPYGP